MILLDERDEYILTEIYKREWRTNGPPPWESENLTLVMGLRLTAAYLSNPLVDLETVAYGLAVPVTDVRLALEDLVPMFRSLSAYGALVAQRMNYDDGNERFQTSRLLEEKPELVEFFK
jgi:hypothetical protein